MDYAKSGPCVLLLDELDTVAKKRDDESEIGELKRLVTVLLQELDDWPSETLLIAATNHASLLDPAVWRRFENWIEFPMPSEEAVRQAINLYLETEELDEVWRDALVQIFKGRSFSRVETEIMSVRRSAAVLGGNLSEHVARLIKRLSVELNVKERTALALDLVKRASLTQRLAHELTGASRDTIRRYSKPEN
jgi:AAA+ superfamily predicted ATPase